MMRLFHWFLTPRWTCFTHFKVSTQIADLCVFCSFTTLIVDGEEKYWPFLHIVKITIHYKLALSICLFRVEAPSNVNSINNKCIHEYLWYRIDLYEMRGISYPLSISDQSILKTINHWFVKKLDLRSSKYKVYSVNSSDRRLWQNQYKRFRVI